MILGRRGTAGELLLSANCGRLSSTLNFLHGRPGNDPSGTEDRVGSGSLLQFWAASPSQVSSRRRHASV